MGLNNPARRRAEDNENRRSVSHLSQPRRPVRLLVLDDHGVVRAGIRSMWEADGRGEVVVSTDRVEVAMEAVVEDRVDVAMVDVSMPWGNGIEFVRDARARNPRVGHVVLTSYREEEAFFQAAIAGAAAFLIKDRVRDQIVDTVLQVAAGGRLIEPGMMDAMADVSADNWLPDDHVLECLTDRERTIVALMARGRTNGEIADELCLAEKTIRNYASNVLAKLGMRNRTEVAAYVAISAARRNGAVVRAAM